MTRLAGRLRRFHFDANAGHERLWKVWWILGIPVGWSASALVVLAEVLRDSSHHVLGDAADVLRLLVYLAWCRLAWGCSRNIERRIWTFVTRALLSAGLLIMALT